MKKEFRQEISSPLDFPFEIEAGGTYTITVRASCQPGWRNQWWLKFKGFLEDILDLHLDDEDLRVEIDGSAFKKPKGRKGLFNSPAAFSGTKTLGKTKIVIFLLHLTQGSHVIKFIPDGSPYLENLEISEQSTPIKFTTQLNARAENENYYAWYTFMIVDQSLYSLSLTAQTGVQKEDKDDDDLKILINGEVQKRPGNRHPQAYFCGFTAQGKEETFTKEVRSPKGTHYIELFADKTPWLKSVELTLSSENLPTAKVVWDAVNLRKEPQTTAEVLARLSVGDTVEVLEKAAKGERPEIKKGIVYLSDRWHRISFQGNTGFIFSEALEIEGESDEEIKRLVQEAAFRLKVDPFLMLALAEVESSFFPYRVSLGNAYGVFQITQSAIDDLKENDQYHFIVTDFFALDQNIEAGIRYFQKLYGKYFKDILEGRMEISLAGYNMGSTNLPKKGVFDLKIVSQDVQDYVNWIIGRYDFYKKQGGFSKPAFVMLYSLSLLFIALLALRLFFQSSPETKGVVEVEKVGQEPEEYKFAGGLVEPGSWELMLDLSGDGEKEIIRVIQQKKRDVFLYFESTASLVDHGKEQIIVEHEGGPLTWFKLVNLDKYGPPEFLFETLEGKLAYTRFYRYQEREFVSIPIIPVRENGEMFTEPGFLGRNGVSLWESESEILVVFYKDQFMEQSCPGDTELYSYYDGKLVKIFNLCSALEWEKEFRG